ncbi:unnamed protein product [Ceratitis capitata]|uniref:(Mediterranean fruit fly) hypothetical protein n=1 Tax=Ceratitis capitata TaxID=7213 RepID=A0A811UK37_CERCA|nr:unnamed protein product [Ceratitis capitata]
MKSKTLHSVPALVAAVHFILQVCATCCAYFCAIGIHSVTFTFSGNQKSMPMFMTYQSRIACADCNNVATTTATKVFNCNNTLKAKICWLTATRRREAVAAVA